MKKIKLLTPILGLTAMAGAVAPLASCSCTTTEEGAKANLTVTSTDNVTIKSSDVALNKDSTVVLSLSQFKAISNVYINVGTVVLAKDKDFSVDVNTNTIKINGSALNNKDVEITVFTATMNGLKASLVDTTKKFEALEAIKASDIKVYPTYDKELIGEINPLSYSTDYLVYDSDKEVENFDTVGYSVTRPDGRSGSKVLTIQYVAKDKFTYDFTFATCPRYEVVSFDSIYYSDYVVQTDKLTTDGLNIRGIMTDSSSKKLEWSKDYTIWDGDTELTEFGTDGYTFDAEGPKTLTIKGVNPEVEYKTITFNVQPVVYKNATCMTNVGDGAATITLQKSGSPTQPDLQYSKDKGANWSSASYGTGIPLAVGETIMFKGNNLNGFNTSNSNYSKINIKTDSTTEGSIAKINLFGSILGLINNDDPKLTPTELPDFCFYYLFSSSNGLVSVSQDFLANVPLSKFCYYSMFSGCTSLINAPALPATTLTENCYFGMFSDCSSLKSAPELPATTLALRCYTNMFNRCENLINVPKILPAKELAEGCYGNMFYLCKQITDAPELPAEKMENNCYSNMFMHCYSLSKAPALNATALADYCYARMFSNCTSLTSASDLPATNLPSSCYYQMFYSCSALENAPKFDAQTVGADSCFNMFGGCKKIKQAPRLSATVLYNDCYAMMFGSCSSLKIAINEGDEDHLIMIAVQDQVEGSMDDPYFRIFYGTKDWDNTTLIKKGYKYYWVEQ